MKKPNKKKKTGSFIRVFFKVLDQIPNLLPDVMIRESMHYKHLRMGGYDPEKLYKGFKNLEGRGYIQNQAQGFRLTRAGIAWARGNKFNYLRLSDKPWDRKWRIVVFDIPEKPFKKQRDIFRSKLKSLGFYLLQKSVFVCPFVCEEELGYVTSHLEIGDYVDVIIADSIGFREEEIKKFYGL